MARTVSLGIEPRKRKGFWIAAVCSFGQLPILAAIFALEAATSIVGDARIILGCDVGSLAIAFAIVASWKGLRSRSTFLVATAVQILSVMEVLMLGWSGNWGPISSVLLFSMIPFLSVLIPCLCIAMLREVRAERDKVERDHIK